MAVVEMLFPAAIIAICLYFYSPLGVNGCRSGAISSSYHSYFSHFFTPL